jgi:hypothetical protein
MGIVLEYREETGSPNGWSEGGKVVVNATLSAVAELEPKVAALSQIVGNAIQ